MNDSTAVDDLEHFLDRLQETLKGLTNLSDSVHDLLDDQEYETDSETCDEYVDTPKRAIRKADKLIRGKREDVKPPIVSLVSAAPTQSTVAQEIKLPTVILETFSGDIEKWSRFWKQFESSIDRNHSVSDINKYVFLRGYLQGEPRRLVDGIAAQGETYEPTKKILQAQYGDRNRIIQAHLDYLDDLKPTQSDSPDALNTVYIECLRRI